MLTITIPKSQLWDAIKEEFLYSKEYTLVLEHSLVSISKWEAKWHKPFLSDEKKTKEETLDYIKCMTLTQNVNDEWYEKLTKENFEDISKYIDDKMSATWFGEITEKKTGSSKKEVITSELIYYWMISYEIPYKYEKWHLNRLITLIKICSAKAKTANKKQSKREILSKNAELNAARRKKLGTSG